MESDQVDALTEEDIRTLIEAAARAKDNAYAPYSGFAVGAALRGPSGEIYTGCNVENASFGLTICAERNAIHHAVAEGARSFVAIAVVTANGVPPCGACRQVLAEFSPGMTVIVADAAGRYRLYPLSEMLPHAFTPRQLQAS